MSELGPLVLRRMLALRGFAMFAELAELAELATLAENVVEATFPAGSVIADRNTRPAALHLVIAGQIESGGVAWGPHEMFGALEVLAGRRVAAPAIAVLETQTLQLLSADIAEVLEDNFGILRVTLRALAAQVLAHAGLPDGVLESEQHRVRTESVGLVERLLLFRDQTLFASARLAALTTLAHGSDEVCWSAGDVVIQPGAPADCMYIIVDGTLTAQRGRGPARVLGRGDAIGGLETVSGVAHQDRLEATSAARGLRSSATAIFDLIEDHADFGLGMIATFAGALLDSSARRVA